MCPFANTVLVTPVHSCKPHNAVSHGSERLGQNARLALGQAHLLPGSGTAFFAAQEVLHPLNVNMMAEKRRALPRCNVL